MVSSARSVQLPGSSPSYGGLHSDFSSTLQLIDTDKAILTVVVYICLLEDDYLFVNGSVAAPIKP